MTLVLALLFTSLVLADAGRNPVLDVPALKRGHLAWENAEASGTGNPHVLRLLVHGVNDDTNRAYAREVRAFLVKVRALKIPFGTMVERGWALARELDERCYARRLTASHGNTLFFGFLHIFPEHRDSPPLAARAVAMRGRTVPTMEGGPAAPETIYVIAEWVAHNVGALEALVIVLPLDAYLREQDWEMLRCEDVYVELRGKDVPSVALLFGRRHRGESVKTGQDQGVCVEDEFVARTIAGLVEGRPRDEKIFGFSSSHFRKVWAKALEALDLQWVGPPHTLRHSGPSFDASTGRRDLEQIRRMGQVEAAEVGGAVRQRATRSPCTSAGCRAT